MESKLFSPVTFGPLTLRNRTIRSAAFESIRLAERASKITFRDKKKFRNLVIFLKLF